MLIITKIQSFNIIIFFSHKIRTELIQQISIQTEEGCWAWWEGWGEDDDAEYYVYEIKITNLF